jgi:hypothetical protein
MKTALQLSGVGAPEVSHTLLAVLRTTVVVLLVTALLVGTAVALQSRTGAAPLSPMTPEPGLDL